jgi:hypothetical protein
MLKARMVNFPPKPIVTQESKEFIKKCLAYSEVDRYDVKEAYDAITKINQKST